MPGSSSPPEGITPERWQRIEELWHSALELEPNARPAFLANACGDDAALRHAIDSLLAYQTDPANYAFDKHAIDIAAQMLAQNQDNKREDPLIGATVGNLKFMGKLGAGGMGIVYKAVNLRLHSYVAIKVLPDMLARDPAAQERFRREARAAAALNHPNICTIHDINEHEGKLFIVMELLEGSTLADRIETKPLPIQKILEWGQEIAEGLAAAHARGIIHRDIKPANIFITNDGRVKILDFGLAKFEAKPRSIAAAIGELSTIANVSTPGVAMGTVPYMSPEQARGEELDTRTDIFSLGGTLYEMATGVRAFPGNNSADILTAILSQEPNPPAQVNPAVPPRLQEIIIKALQKDPAARYQSAAEMRTELHELDRKPAGKNAGRIPATGWQATTKLIALGAVLLMLVGLLAAHFWPAPAISSLAVLPFVNGSNDSDMEYLSDGLTESVIDDLSQIPNLRIMARSTVFRYKGKELDPQKAGHDLNVRAVLSGEVLQRGNTLTVRAELVDSSNGLRLWGGQFNRPAASLISLQQDLAKQISEALSLRLSGDDKLKLAKRPTEIPEAYQLFLKGRYEFNRLTPDRLEKAIDFFQQAIQKDPNYAQAYAGMADSYNTLSFLGTLPPRELMPKSEAASRKALELDGNLAEPHVSLGWANFTYDWDWNAAQAHFVRALALNPSYPEAAYRYAFYLAAMGRNNEAIAQAKRTVELDPANPAYVHLVASQYYLARQFDRALDECRRAEDLDPSFSLTYFVMGHAYSAKGMHREALASYQHFLTTSPKSALPLAFVAHEHARLGDTGQARMILKQLEALSKKTYVPAFAFAIVYIGLDDREQSLAWLEKAVLERTNFLAYLRAQATFDPLRSDPRFEELERRVGLPLQ